MIIGKVFTIQYVWHYFLLHSNLRRPSIIFYKFFRLGAPGQIKYQCLPSEKVNKIWIESSSQILLFKFFFLALYSFINNSDSRKMQTMVAYSICLMKQKTCHRFPLHLNLVLCPPALPPHHHQGWKELQRWQRQCPLLPLNLAPFLKLKWKF